MGVQTDRGFVEDVGDVGQTASQVPDELHALGFTAREGGGGTVQGEVAQADVDEGVQGLAQSGEQGSGACDSGDLACRLRGVVVPRAGCLEASDPLSQVPQRHGAGIGDRDAGDACLSSRLGQPGALALRAGAVDDGALNEGTHVRLHGFGVLGQHRGAQAADEPLVGHGVGGDLDLGRLLVQEVVQLLGGEVLDGLVGGEQAGFTQGLDVVAVGRVAGDLDRALAQREHLVIDLSQVDVRDLPGALTARAHAGLDGVLLALAVTVRPFLTVLRGATTGDGGHIEGEGLR